MSLVALFLILAFICFIMSACGLPLPRIGLESLGLAFWVLAEIFARGVLH